MPRNQQTDDAGVRKAIRKYKLKYHADQSDKHLKGNVQLQAKARQIFNRVMALNNNATAHFERLKSQGPNPFKRALSPPRSESPPRSRSPAQGNFESMMHLAQLAQTVVTAAYHQPPKIFKKQVPLGAAEMYTALGWNGTVLYVSVRTSEGTWAGCCPVQIKGGVRQLGAFRPTATATSTKEGNDRLKFVMGHVVRVVNSRLADFAS